MRVLPQEQVQAHEFFPVPVGSNAVTPGSIHHPNLMLQLQRAVGNQAVLRWLKSGTAGADAQGATSDIDSSARPTSSTETFGEPLGSAHRQWFEQRTGQHLGEVRMHHGPQVDDALGGQAALAATLGRDVAMSSAVGPLDTDRGSSVLAHELIHVAQQKDAIGSVAESPDPGAEHQAHTLAGSMALPGTLPAVQRVARPAVMFLTTASGQHTDTKTGGLTADLTSPVVTGRVVRFQIDISPAAVYTPATTLSSPYQSYHWDVFDRNTGANVASATSLDNQREIVYPRAGRFRVECVFVDPRKGKGATPAVTLDQDVVAEDATLAASLSSDSDYSEAERELVDDLKSYVIGAAASTGAQGITARLLAAILREEIANTNAVPTWLPFANTNKEERKSELAGVEAAIRRKASGSTVAAKEIDRSVGVGQVKLSTAAMAKGLITWTEAAPGNKQPARDTVSKNFSALPEATLTDLHTLLAWPKSNIQTAADVLAKLKNRSNRYPSMGRASFGANQRACEIIATEYNQGPTNSLEALAQASSYGQRIWTYMSLPLLQSMFPNS